MANTEEKGGVMAERIARGSVWLLMHAFVEEQPAGACPIYLSVNKCLLNIIILSPHRNPMSQVLLLSLI